MPLQPRSLRHNVGGLEFAGSTRLARRVFKNRPTLVDRPAQLLWNRAPRQPAVELWAAAGSAGLLLHLCLGRWCWWRRRHSVDATCFATLKRSLGHRRVGCTWATH